jgi:hypothetical protein
MLTIQILHWHQIQGNWRHNFKVLFLFIAKNAFAQQSLVAFTLKDMWERFCFHWWYHQKMTCIDEDTTIILWTLVQHSFIWSCLWRWICSDRMVLDNTDPGDVIWILDDNSCQHHCGAVLKNSFQKCLFKNFFSKSLLTFM